MTLAIGAPRDPYLAVEGLIGVLTRLRRDLGVTVHFEPIEDDIAYWNGDTKILTVDSESPPTEQIQALLQAWALFALGPEASYGAEQVRRLRAV